MPTHPSPCPTPGPTRGTAALVSRTPALGSAPQRVTLVLSKRRGRENALVLTDVLLDFTGDELPSRHSPRPLRASLMSSSSTSSFRRALSSMRESPSVSPVVPTTDARSCNNKRLCAASSPQQLDRDLHLEPFDGIVVKQDQDENPLDMEEVRKPLHHIMYNKTPHL